MSAASRPQEAAWLSREERDYILAGQRNPAKKPSAHDYKHAILNPQVLLMSAVYAFWLIGATGLFMWIPAIIKTLSGAGVTYTSYVSTLPYITAMAGLLFAGRISDRTIYKNRVVAVVMLGLGVFLLLSVVVPNYILSLAFLVLSGTFLFAAHAPFWAIAAENFPPPLRGSAMGMISLLGNLGAFVGPYTVGYINEKTGSFSSGMLFLVASLGIAAALATQIRTVSKVKGFNVHWVEKSGQA
jgi:MFS transporter, ACS family, tartrate transporter